MLQEFFAVCIILIIFLIALVIIKVVLPVWRFIEGVDVVIGLYDVFKIQLKNDFFGEEKIQVSYGKYKLEFANTNEASIEFEKMIGETLAYLDKLGWITTGDDVFTIKKNELISIWSEVRRLRLKKQGI